MNDTEMLNWLAAHCWFPPDFYRGALTSDICVFVSTEIWPVGMFNNQPENDRRALREAIQKARLKELHEKANNT